MFNRGTPGHFIPNEYGLAKMKEAKEKLLQTILSGRPKKNGEYTGGVSCIVVTEETQARDKAIDEYDEFIRQILK